MLTLDDFRYVLRFLFCLLRECLDIRLVIYFSCLEMSFTHFLISLMVWFICCSTCVMSTQSMLSCLHILCKRGERYSNLNKKVKSEPNYLKTDFIKTDMNSWFHLINHARNQSKSRQTNLKLDL